MIEGTPFIPGLGEGPEAEPGASVWVDKYEMVATPGQQGRLVAGSFSQLWTGTLPTGRIRFQVLEQVAPVPPPKPALVAFTVTPTTALPGSTLRLVVGLQTNTTVWVPITVTTPFGIIVVTVPAGKALGENVIAVPIGQSAGTITLTATDGTVVLPYTVNIVLPAPEPEPPKPDPIPIPPPGPVPPVLRTIDMTGKTQAQIQAAINTAQPGDGIFLGPGLYTLSAAMGGDGQRLDILNRDGIHLFGAGASTVLDFAGQEGIWARQGGRIGQGNVIRDMALRNCRRAVCALDPQRLFVQRVEVTGASHGYASERTTAYDNGMFEWPVTLEAVIVRSWGKHGAMLHGGETVKGCQFIDTPGNSGSTYSHGLYIQGSRNVLIEDVLIENASGHAWQIYSDSATHAANGAENVVMRRITCRNGRYGPIIAANGRYTNLLIEDMTVVGTVSRETGTFVISATNDWIEGLVMRNITLDGGGEGLVLQGGQTGGIRNMLLDGLRITNHNVGIVVGPSGWPYTKIESSVVKDYRAQGVPLPVRGSSSGLVLS